METQAQRYAIIRAKTGLSNQDFARSLGIAPALSSSIESGKRSASRDVLTRIAETYRISISWFLTGISDSTIPESGDSQTLWIQHIDQEAAAGSGADIEDFSSTHLIPVPLSLVYPYKASQVRAVTVRGDSMIGKEIFDKDIVIFAPKETEGDGIYVLSIAGTLLVKRVSFDLLNSELSLISENPLYPVRTIQGQDLSEVKIEGKVIGCYHRL